MALCSIAVAAGIVGVVALVKRALFRRRYMMMGGPAVCGGFGGHGPWGGASPRRRWGGGPGGSVWLRAVFAKLDTTPGQEKEIRSAIEDLQREAREARDDVKASRGGVARAIAAETFDEIAIGEASVKVDAATARAKNALEAALRRVHAVLDPKQRERLASLLENGPRSFFSPGIGGGPYRGGAVEI